MIKHILFTSFSTLFLIFTSSSVFANEMISTNAVKASTVISMIQAQGYRDVFDFDYANGDFFVKAIDKDNEIVRITVNARTNEILRVKDTECHMRKMTHPVSMLDAVRKAEWAGVRKIYDVDIENGAYEILGFNVNDQRVEYLVDFNTGVMKRSH